MPVMEVKQHSARTRTGWIKLRECGELRNGRKLVFKMK